VHVSVNVPPRDKELIEWVQRLKSDDVKVSAAIRRVLRAHIRAEEKLTVEAIADAVVIRLRKEGLVLVDPYDDGDEGDFVEAVLNEAARGFIEVGTV